jgi:hypothetical protein
MLPKFRGPNRAVHELRDAPIHCGVRQVASSGELALLAALVLAVWML